MPSSIIRVTTAGSVDDGKSTLLAQLLLQTGALLSDQVDGVGQGSLADALDGLRSEREQGITIDVAHRFTDYDGVRFHFADSPGHVQYTRNMATACAGSHVLLLVVDAAQGPREQTIRHLEIAIKLGVSRIVVAVNKLDLLNYSQEAFSKVASEVESIIKTIKQRQAALELKFIPVSALTNENIARPGAKMKWHSGPTLLDAIKSPVSSTAITDTKEELALLQVQLVQRLESSRLYLGTVTQGSIQQGELLWHRNTKFTITSLYVSGVRQEFAFAGDQVAITVGGEFDIARGDILSAVPIEAHDLYDAELIWLGDKRARKNTNYIIKFGSATSSVQLTRIFSVNSSGTKLGEVSGIETNDLAQANILLGEQFFLQKFSGSHLLSSFVIIDPKDGQTLAVGTINHFLRRSENLKKQDFVVSSDMLREVTGNNPAAVWLTGLSGSGKSTLANKLSQELYRVSKPHFILDGDNLRLGLNRDLGFTDADRNENIRRTSEVARLMLDAGLIVIVAMISPSESDRELAKGIIGANRFKLVYLNTPLEVCELRDSKGLYRKARNGEIPNFTGVTAPYERPRAAVEVGPDMDIVPSEFLEMLGL